MLKDDYAALISMDLSRAFDTVRHHIKVAYINTSKVQGSVVALPSYVILASDFQAPIQQADEIH